MAVESVVPRPLRSVSPPNRYDTVPVSGVFHDGGLIPSVVHHAVWSPRALNARSSANPQGLCPYAICLPKIFSTFGSADWTTQFESATTAPI